MKVKTSIFVLLVALFWCCNQASAQRTMQGRSIFTLGSHYNGSSFGAEAFFGQYVLAGYWNAGIKVSDYGTPLSTGDQLHYNHIAAAGEFMFRLVSTRRRTINLYVGAGAFAGIELVDFFHRLPSYLALPVPDKNFLYGIYGKVLAEFYLGRHFALTLEGSVPMTFPGRLGWLRWHAGIGMRITI